ncbi:hypothetical protein EV401DRAFT_157361 [Pisolithus croceorrhizus]|nr:hypothetical protein EV401DRAFT_157361 [Pisolithus croceorrhizus]
MLPPLSVSVATECYLRKNFQHYLLANDLQVRAKKMMACFRGSFLPLPTDDLSSAWDELPNNTVYDLRMSFKAHETSLRAPPPTPIDANFTVDGVSTTCGSSSSALTDDESPFVYETDSPTPDVVVFKVIALGPSNPHYLPLEDSGDTCHSGTNRLCGGLTTGALAEPALQSPEMTPSASDFDSTSMSPRISSMPFPEFRGIVDSSVADIHQRSIQPFVDSLLISGVETIQSASLVSEIACAVIQQISNTSYTEAEELTKAIRVGALEMFQYHWKLDGEWYKVSSTSTECSPSTWQGLNKAGLMGSLFNAQVATVEDIFSCLFILLEGEKHFDRLCAMHALLVQADDQLCESRNLRNLTRFVDSLSVRDRMSGCFAWAPTPHARTMLEDIFDAIAGWECIQAIKSQQYEARAKNHLIPLHSVGPRLRSNI